MASTAQWKSRDPMRVATVSSASSSGTPEPCVDESTENSAAIGWLPSRTTVSTACAME